MLKLWYKFRRLIGFPCLDLELPMLFPFVGDFDFQTMRFKVRRDVEYWLNRAVGPNNWRCEFDNHYAGLNEMMPYEQAPSVVVLLFRHQRNMDLYKENWFSGREK